MFSIVIPLYNKSAYIQKAIDSVINQTFRDFELIIVNDGSTDNSLEKVKLCIDNRIKIIDQPNAGVSNARNNGVKHAKYDYIAFLDADDWWDVNFLKEMNDLIFNFGDAAIYASNHYSVKSGVNRKPNIGIEASFVAGYINYFKVYAKTFWVPVNCSFVVLRKKIFEKEKGFNEKLKFGEDLDLWLRVALNHKVAFVNKFLAYSNQDVPAHNRALGEKLWEKNVHVIFNLDYLVEAEKRNVDLKKLLDGLRVRSLVNYFINKKYVEEVNKIMSSVKLSEQPILYRFIYRYPQPLVKLYFFTKEKGSMIKRGLMNLIKR